MCGWLGARGHDACKRRLIAQEYIGRSSPRAKTRFMPVHTETHNILPGERLLMSPPTAWLPADAPLVHGNQLLSPHRQKRAPAVGHDLRPAIERDDLFAEKGAVDQLEYAHNG